jgi:hypothetical protein
MTTTEGTQREQQEAHNIHANDENMQAQIGQGMQCGFDPKEIHRPLGPVDFLTSLSVEPLGLP